MPKKRMIFFDFVTHYGGAQRSTVYALKRLTPFFDILVLDPYGACADFQSALAEEGIPVETLVPSARNVYIGHQGNPIKRGCHFVRQIPQMLRLGARLFRAVRRLRPEVVLTNSPKAICFLYAISWFKRVPIAFYARGWYQYHQLPWAARFMIRRAQTILAVSRATARALRQWGIPEAHIHVAPTILDFDDVRAESAAALADPLPHPDAPYKILMPAQWIWTKGQAVAVEAAAVLYEQRMSFAMWLCGDVKMGADHGYRETVIQRIRSLGLQEAVFVLGHRSDLRALIKRSDCLVLPTQTEGFPRVIWEAMILKCPVVATAAGGIVDLVENEQTGLLVEFGDSVGLARAIRRLMEDKPLRERLVEQAYQRVITEYASDKTTDALVGALQAASC